MTSVGGDASAPIPSPRFMPRVREEREVVGEEEGVLMLSEQVELGVVMAGEEDRASPPAAAVAG